LTPSGTVADGGRSTPSLTAAGGLTWPTEVWLLEADAGRKSAFSSIGCRSLSRCSNAASSSAP